MSTSTINFSDEPRIVITELPTEKKGKLCLNMIVKNESRIIKRLFDSVIHIIDSYCISDTGSTDDTIQIIQEYMKAAGKPGEVYTEPFQNFGYNRTHALERAATWGEYALLLDADMKLIVLPEFNKDTFTDYAYNIIQKNETMEYYNLRIAKTGIGITCVGPTHEYYNIPQGKQSIVIRSLRINDIGDGGAKADKFERDVRLLTKGLETEPTNARYMFYLANSYRDLLRPRDAIQWYKKRVDAGGWVEEVFYAAYEMGNQYKAIGDLANAVYWWMEAYNRHPKRAESLYELTKYYRETGKHHIGQLMCNAAKAIPFPTGDVLFIKHNVYDYLLDYEHSVLAYYSGAKVDHYKYLDLIGRNFNKINVLSNYVFYARRLSDMTGVRIYDFGDRAEKLVGGRMDSFISSSPSILPWEDGYLLNVRYVNYIIQPNGSYAFKHADGKITTLNLTLMLNKDLTVKSKHWLDEVDRPNLQYQGVEDVKVFNNSGQLLFLGTVQHPTSYLVTVGAGSYDLSGSLLSSHAFTSPFGRECEKNWCYFHDSTDALRVVYDWSPLMYGHIDGQSLVIDGKHESVPPFFRDVRGSTHGVRVGNEVWFLCHIANYTMPRGYYHLFVVLDAVQFVYKRHSTLFKFHNECIEYALGLVIEPERILISYSRMDRTSAVITVPRQLVDSVLFKG
jgi:tetratricopeptide (TPR) repeat protein